MAEMVELRDSFWLWADSRYPPSDQQLFIRAQMIGGVDFCPYIVGLRSPRLLSDGSLFAGASQLGPPPYLFDMLDQSTTWTTPQARDEYYAFCS
jgi:hypothetical protein